MTLVKTLHIAAGVLWLGNFVITGLWSVRAFADGRAALRRFAVREIIFTDVVFTFVAGAAVTMSGIGLASLEGIPVWGTFWTRAALITSFGSGLLWLAWLVPLELRMRTLVEREPDGTRLMRAFVWWNIGGWSITVALFAIIYLMVGKPV
jgi:uncharacterized membrane protein